MVHFVAIWLLAAAFLGAGLFNGIGGKKAQGDFVRWGYPRWWGRLTAALEIFSALLIALPATRVVGLALGTMIIAAAVLTVLRHRELTHLAPLGAFAAVVALAAISS